MASLTRQKIFRFANSRILPRTSRPANLVGCSSRGLGKAIALRLAADGYDVCVNDVSAHRAGCDELVKEIQNMGRNSCTAIADVTKRDEVKQMIQTSVDALGPLNTMIANAGIAQVKPVLELTEQDFERMFAVNVFGVQNCFAEAAKQMIIQGNCKPDHPGKLIAAASIVAFKPFVMLPHYSASKYAVRGLTQAYAMDMADHHITANAYAPGIVGTAMWELIDAETGKRKGLPKGEVMRRMVYDSTALQRVSVPEDVAKLVSFLASSDSDFVTGQTQLVDGGIVYT
ncbi:NAD(P)-binding protein [Hypoxylon trugodes]|uniref:NAD(P)-binding protein n=1 Tax=Hypoxylon trugodes TaxID=326681 RepID=UPI002193916D|nr:NAD(P)-binding protein [Hypoxylon trugodes]KAI1387599.1 NAD(P)-binding protein [Hypoxylon trugodes]